MPWLDFRTQAIVGAASRSLVRCMEWTYAQLDFEQNDFPWTWKKGKDEEILVHCHCIFIASLAAACFYDSPSLVTGNWSSPELWRDFHVEGSVLHRSTRGCTVSIFERPKTPGHALMDTPSW